MAWLHPYPNHLALSIQGYEDLAVKANGQVQRPKAFNMNLPQRTLAALGQEEGMSCCTSASFC